MNKRPQRPWPYWYEVRIEYMSLFQVRPKKWWRDIFSLPYHVWLCQRAERSLFEVISPDDLREALIRHELDYE